VKAVWDIEEDPVVTEPKVRSEKPDAADDEPRIKEVDVNAIIQAADLEDAGKFSPHALKNPERIKINEIIKKVSSKNWMLPHFQRYFDWGKDDIREFLESIFNDYYVGAILLWQTDREPELDIMTIAGMEPEESYDNVEAIILDGQQRITSLYYAVKAPRMDLKGNNHPLYYYLNFMAFLQNEDGREIVEFHAKKMTREESYQKALFPMYEFENYQEWVDGFEDFLSAQHTDQNKVKQIRRIIEKKLRHMWGGFEIPYIVLPSSMGIDQVTDIFEKINTKGIRLNVFDLLIARLHKYDIRLKNVG